MPRQSIRFRILLIDDDAEMNSRLEGLLTGCRLSVGGIEVVPEVDRVDVALEEKTEQPGIWRIKEETLKQLHFLSQSPGYNLVMTDFGFVTDEAKDILWGRDRSRKPTKNDAKGRILSIRDLRLQFEEWRTHVGQRRSAAWNVFTSARRVILRSFASRLAFDILGPVIPNRSLETQAAFPNAEIVAIDSRQEFFGNDEFYEIYERPDGRDFYRYLVGTYSTRVIESEMLRHVIKITKNLRIKRSVFNIALFAGAVTLIGGAAQYLSGIGLGLLDQGRPMGWWFIVGGLLALVFGALGLSLTFEWFARTVVRWVGPEEEFKRE